MTDANLPLRVDALGVTESVIMGTAGAGPAYSISASMATLVAAVGVLAPASLLYCGLLMMGIVFAFQHLNRMDADAGASYAWVGRIFSPGLGFLAGWALLISSILFMVSGTIPAATATLTLVAPDLVDNLNAVTLVSAFWVVVIGAIVAKGIKLTSYTQVAITVLEVGVIVALIGLGLLHFINHPMHAITFDWFTGRGFTPSLFAAGALASLFSYSGWDVTVNLNEETRDGSRTAGTGSVVSMVIVMALFVSFSAVMLMTLTSKEIDQAGTNVLFTTAQKLLPKPWDSIAVIAVMLSTVGALETSILQFTRTMFSMARGGAIPARYARLHPTYRTPMAATVMITILGLALLLLSSYLPSVNVVIKDSINAIGFQVAVYYGLAGLACAWHYRGSAIQSIGGFVFLFAWPLLGALSLFGIALYSVPNFDLTTNLVGLGGIAIGIVPYLMQRRRVKPAAESAP